jgi:hypothetical protein
MAPYLAAIQRILIRVMGRRGWQAGAAIEQIGRGATVEQELTIRQTDGTNFSSGNSQKGCSGATSIELAVELWADR